MLESSLWGSISYSEADCRDSWCRLARSSSTVSGNRCAPEPRDSESRLETCMSSFSSVNMVLQGLCDEVLCVCGLDGSAPILPVSQGSGGNGGRGAIIRCRVWVGSGAQRTRWALMGCCDLIPYTAAGCQRQVSGQMRTARRRP